MSTADLEEVLDHLTSLVEEARALPLSSSCVVHRGEVLDLVDEARRVAPGELEQARRLLADREELLEQARAEADRTVEQARAEADLTLSQAREERDRLLEQGREEQERLVQETAVLTRAQEEADRVLREAATEADLILDQAHADGEAMRRQTEDYVDGKLAGFEHLLGSTLEAVQRGRDRLSAPDDDRAAVGPQAAAPPDEADARVPGRRR